MECQSRDFGSTSFKTKGKLWRPFEESPSSLEQFRSSLIRVPTPFYPLPGNVFQAKIDLSGTKAKLLGNVTSSFYAIKRKRVACLLCPSMFFNNGQLAGHMAVHSGDRPFRCDFENCPRAFARNEELTRHRRIHTGDKPHGCDLCPKRFGRKDHLSKHRRTHQRLAEKKVHLCPVNGCGHSYTRSDALARHIGATHTKFKRNVNL